MKTLTQAIDLAKKADMWTWWRGDGTYSTGQLTIYLDDHDRDTRTVYEIKFRKGRKPDIKTTHLSGYETSRNIWTIYNRPTENITLANKRGEKALRAYVKGIIAENHFYQNPETYTYYANN